MISRENRFLFVETPLGPDKLLLESYTGREAMSELFSFQLELVSENLAIDFAKLLGSGITFGVAGLGNAEKRCIHGIVTAFSQLPTRARVARYRATVSPSIWKLTRTQHSRIFQQLSVPDIVQKVLAGFAVESNVHRTYEPREYCVQYRESDFEFVSRLMEEEGIFYFFEHSEGSDKLIIDDSPLAHKNIPGTSTLTYDEIEGGERDELCIFDWQKTQHWDSGKVTLRDHCFIAPNNTFEQQQGILPDVQVGKVSHELNVAGNDPQMEIYEYPGGYARHFEGGGGDQAASNIGQDGQEAARTAIGRIEAAQFVIRGQSNVYDLIPGYRFTLAHHFNGDGDYVVTSVTHSAAEGGMASERGAKQEPHFSNIFTCIPFAITFRPQRATPKPQVRGCQTAYVVGPDGEEIYTDEYGRIKVQFHWDRQGVKNDKSSCWVRVASYWAGKMWGAFHLPRIGQEVVVDFLEGDPDRPIVVGSVYNAENMPPYALPDNKTQSTIKSRSSKEGSADNFNEIRFEDKKGSEEVYFQAEKDLNSLIKNDETRDVKHDRKVKIEHDDSKDVTHDLTLTVGHNRTGTVTNDDALTVNHDRTATIANNDSETIGKDQTRTVGGKSTSTVAQNNTETVGGNESVTIAGSQTVTIAASESHTTGASRTTTVGAADSTTVAATVTLNAGGGVTIMSGGPISITAPMVSVTAAMVQCAGVVQCTTLIATSVVSPAYTPGAGNML